MNEFPDDLKAALQCYRDAHPDPEMSATFMPGLWQKIEARRRTAGSLAMLRRLAQTYVGFAVTAGLILGVYVIPRLQDRQNQPQSSYAEVVAIDDAQQELAKAFTVTAAYKVPATFQDGGPE
jgi:hypothetical protein